MDKKFLIINPKNGLCNQLSSISIGVILGMISNRNVIFTSFQLDYKNSDNNCNFDTIIDIIHLQNILNKLNCNVKILTNTINEKKNTEVKNNYIKINIPTNEDIANIKDFIPYLLDKKNDLIKYLDIGCPISTIIPNEYHNILNSININIKFTNNYIKIANNIKNTLKLNNYFCVHLRLEDDSINFMKELNPKLSFDNINNIYKNKYIEEFETLKNFNNKIYVCTSLGINNNINNTYYLELKKKYNIIDKNDIIKISNNNCREIYGIIDFIIAQDSLYFIGSDWSSFSIYLYNSHKHRNKNAKLINIWNTLKDMK
jgi:hypothetical protein